ncbi:MAG: hypothetical protein Q4F75_05595, partial [Pseudomonadota bacterium]|nr:hypothetical protein [Pseudomonadota bacterium]
FFLSLFAVITVNGLISRASKSSQPETPLSHKNISLFLKNDGISLPHKAVSVKKIALVKPAASLQPDEAQNNAFIDISNNPPEAEAVEQPVSVSLTEENLSTPAPQKEKIIALLERTELPKYEAGEDLPSENSDVTSGEEERQPKDEEPHTSSDTHTLNRPQQLAFAHQENTPPPPTNKVYKDEDYSGRLLIPLQRDGKKPVYTNNKITIDGRGADRQLAAANANKVIKDIPSSAPKEESTKENQSDSLPSDWETLEKKKDTLPLTSENKGLYDMQKVEIPEEVPTDASQENTAKDDTWLAAKGTNFPKNNTIKNADYFQRAEDKEKISQILSGVPSTESNSKEVKVAGEVVKNILIPIPEDIMQDKNLTPQLVSDPQDKLIEDELTEKEKEEKLFSDSPSSETAFPFETPQTTEASGNKSSGLFKSLTSIFSGSDNTTPLSSAENVSPEKKNTGKSFFSNDYDIPMDGKILPTEIRLSFQANRAEISGKTLKWVQAFGEKAKNNENIIIEIRIDGTTSYELQQKRLNLLYNILTNLGLDYSKVNTVFTNREANSFILRTVKAKENNEKESDSASLYYRRW